MSAPPLYQSLDETDRDIRLLQIDISNGKPQYSLDQADVDHAEYHALSYTWGDTKNRRLIQVDGRNISITAYLSRALEDVATFWRKTHTDKPILRIWVDQICINQKDEEEKSYQVSMMRDIYRNAQHVLLWLPLGRDVKFGFRNWTAWSEWHRQQITSPQPSSLPPGKVAMSYDAICQPRHEYPVDSEGDSVVKSQMTAWENVQSIVTSPWWERAWGYAEFMQSNETTFLFGGLWASREAFENMFTLYDEKREAHIKFCTLTLNMLQHQEGQGTQKSSGFCGCFGRGDDDTPVKDPNVAKEQRMYLRRHSQRLIDLSPYWDRVRSRFAAKTEYDLEDRTDQSTLSTLMKQVRDLKVSDPKDRVYASLSLGSSEHNIRVDYSLPESTVFTHAARSIMQKEQRLEILAIACEDSSNDPESDQSPSWVPTWSTKDDPDSSYRQFLRQIQFPMSRYSYSGGRPGTRASQSSNPIFYCFPNGILQARGIFIDRLNVMVANDESKLFRTFITDFGRKVSTVKNAETGDEVWIFLGADEVFTLRKEGELYILLGHAMVREGNGETSDVLLGSMMDKLKKGAVSTSDIRIK